MKKINLAIFASGAGSNAENIINYFQLSEQINIALIVCNNPKAGVISIAAKHHIPLLLIERDRYFRGEGYIEELKREKIDFVILAGFLWKIPPALIDAFPNKIINIHPALLPAFGGKGMYGKHVHEAVLSSGSTQSGITIHYVDEKFDNGKHIFQTTCPVYENDTVESLTQRVHLLEHSFYPKVIEHILLNKNIS